VSPVKYELGSYIPEDDVLHSHCRVNLKSYILPSSCLEIPQRPSVKCRGASLHSILAATECTDSAAIMCHIMNTVEHFYVLPLHISQQATVREPISQGFHIRATPDSIRSQTCMSVYQSRNHYVECSLAHMVQALSYKPKDHRFDSQ
jgi:hypothetical protein